MSKHFYKDVKVIKFCKFCGVSFRPQRGSFFSSLGLCHKHRRVYYRNWYINKFLPFFAKLTPEQQQKYRDMRYATWKKWVSNNVERRRLQALESYHRNKDKPQNKARRHRRTHSPVEVDNASSSSSIA